MDRPVSFDVTDYYPDGDEWSTTDLIPQSDSMSGPSSPTNQNSDPEEEYVTVTLEFDGDRVYVHSMTPAANHRSSVEENPKPIMLQKQKVREKCVCYRRRRPVFGASMALKKLEMFICMPNAGWIAAEKRFEKITAKTGGLLFRSKFGECVEEFSLELFDTLARRWNIKGEVVDKAKLWNFYEEINDQSFGSRLKIFFEMADKDDDGKITHEEVREFIRFIALANNGSTIQHIDEYAALIMQAVDPNHMGYITMENLGWLLLDVETLNKMISMKKKKKSTKRWWKVQNMIPRFKKRAMTTKKGMILQYSDE